MKKILRVFLLVLALTLLVGCMNNYKEVDLSYAEAKEELQNLEVVESESLELDLDLDFEADENNKLKVKSNVLVNKNNQLMLDAKVNGAILGIDIDGDAKFYVVDEGLFVDGKLVAKTDDVSIDIDGKKKIMDMDDDIDDEDGLDFNDLLDFDIDELVNSEDFKKLVEEYDGLTFYKSKDKLKVELIINNELVEENKDLFKDLEMLEINTDEDVDLKFELVVKDNKVQSISVDLSVDNEDMKLHLKLKGKVSKKKLNLPDFSKFEDLEL